MRGEVVSYGELAQLFARASSGDGAMTRGDQARAHLVLQLLALDERLFEEAHLHSRAARELQPRGGDGESVLARAHQALADALMAFEALDIDAALAALAEVLTDANGGDPLFAEARGARALMLALYGQTESASSDVVWALSTLRESELDWPGPARAGADIASVLLEVGRTDPVARAEARAAASESAPGGAYEGLFHYVMMLSLLDTHELEAALDHFLQIQHVRTGRRASRLRDLVAVMIYAGLGELGTAARRLDVIDADGPLEYDPSDAILRAILRARLDLARGRDGRARRALDPDGRLSEARVRGDAPRYQAGVLMLRASLRARSGDDVGAAQLFEAAAAMTDLTGEYLITLLCDTAELRQWARGVTTPGRLLAMLLHRPVLIGSVAPRLTEQQLRILTV